ncbi:MAG: serine/threonine protein kinase, partial [Bacteroidetes bacterium]|nr:serine/threonine protein kinase [Bacteroidota bacterium]
MIGKTVSHYQILSKLGEGGMGVVYKALDTGLGREVALKFLPPSASRDAEAKERFMREAKSASALDHANICTIFEIGETDDGQLFMAMALYDGESLEDRLSEGPMQESEAVDIARQVALGLAAAHEAGIVHRDIKPANVIITSKGVAKVLDFGVAKLGGSAALTQTGASVGTMLYMSPEQARGDDVDARADIWSLGGMLYEMISGSRPFSTGYDAAILYAILNEDPTPLKDLMPDVSEAVS